MKYIKNLIVENVYMFDMVYVPSGEIVTVKYDIFNKYHTKEIDGERMFSFNKEIDGWTIKDKFRRQFEYLHIARWS